jgi:hypothetical protein
MQLLLHLLLLMLSLYLVLMLFLQIRLFLLLLRVLLLLLDLLKVDAVNRRPLNADAITRRSRPQNVDRPKPQTKRKADEYDRNRQHKLPI